MIAMDEAAAAKRFSLSLLAPQILFAPNFLDQSNTSSSNESGNVCRGSSKYSLFPRIAGLEVPFHPVHSLNMNVSTYSGTFTSIMSCRYIAWGFEIQGRDEEEIQLLRASLIKLIQQRQKLLRYLKLVTKLNVSVNSTYTVIYTHTVISSLSLCHFGYFHCHL